LRAAELLGRALLVAALLERLLRLLLLLLLGFFGTLAHNDLQRVLAKSAQNDVLALHIDSCSPELLRLVRHSASGDCGRSFGRGSGSQSGHPTPPRIRTVQSWDVRAIDAPEGTRRAAALETVDGARAIVIRLAPGEELGDHQVRERAWLIVVEGSARIEAGGDVVEAGSGTLLTFEPDERHKVFSLSGTRIVMILSSWPADGHYPALPG
jgi:quercetin dioxygenase-like cupin family protein